MTKPFRPILHIAALAAVLLTSACITPGDPGPGIGPGPEIGRWVPIEPGRARVILASPQAGEALAARELRTTQGEVVQTITLPNNTAVPGDNEIIAAFDYGPPSIFAKDIYTVSKD
jgi:hypothetical protein